MLRGRYDLRPIDRLIINLCLRSCNESSEEMSDKNTETALAAIEAAPFTEGTRVATTPRTQPHGVPRPPSLSSEIGILEKELQTLELHKRKMQLLQLIDA